MLSMLIKVWGDLARVEGVRQNARAGCLFLEHHVERVQEGRVAGRGAGPVAQDDVARCEAGRVHVPLRAAELWGRPRLEDGEGGACACSSVWVFVEEVDVLNALMNMYVKCGYVVAAGKVFDSMAVMDFISWNAAGHFFLRMVTAIQGWSCFLLCCRIRFSLTSGSFGMEMVVMYGYLCHLPSVF